ncbi:CIA30 family protein [Colwellia psychrerythraea]|uniref:NADH:ubiquinone oxidoreductase complex I intermediate-associated protein 30 n=1 Tax=Colwellia psychrerythraea TaxID=28229 RepID=A0A099KDZ5_COLPS|nr:CIA30 family protein [Colwellia psychrerythraea]KGJ88979.1 NADH:ubiquinone oxidoreductase complex I intermediate-associated protein 30 [Colwellia psychrerythraea]
MRKLSRTITSLFAGLSCISSLSVQAIDLRIDNVRLYQAEQSTFSQPSTLYIEDGKIVEITTNTTKRQTTVKAADKVVDAHNSFALPGLIDLHVHLGSSGSNYGKDFQYLPVDAHFNSNLYLGVTSIVDLFSFDITLNEAKHLTSYKTSPNLFYAGVLFTNPGGHGTQFGGSALEVTSDDAIEDLWQQHMARKPHLTKAVIETFGGHGDSLTDSQLTEIGKRSKAAGLPYFVHVSTLVDGKRAIKAGATALAHGINTEAVDDEFIALMIKHNVAYIPTLAVYQNHSAEHETQQISSNTALLATVPDKLQHCLFDKVPEPSKWKNIAWQKRQLAYQNITLVAQAGITIGTGSDAGNPYTLHGSGLHNELQALSKSGLTNAQVINAATIDAAKIINAPELGQLKVGFQASFILLTQNPLNDISQVSNIQAVYKSGNKVDRKGLIAQNKKIALLGEECNAAAIIATTAKEIIDNFDSEIKWQAISDTMMGGQSTSKLAQQDDMLSVDTLLGKPGGFGAWAGMQVMFETPVDASQYKGVKITYQGSKVPFGISVYHNEVQDWDHFSATLQPSETWTTVKVPFAQLQQFGFGSQKDWSAKSLAGLSLVWRTMPGQQLASNKNTLQISNISYF